MPKDLSARSTIMCSLEVFCEHGVPSFIRTDRGRNFASKDFNQFIKDLGILIIGTNTVYKSSSSFECYVPVLLFLF